MFSGKKVFFQDFCYYTPLLYDVFFLFQSKGGILKCLNVLICNKLILSKYLKTTIKFTVCLDTSADLTRELSHL